MDRQQEARESFLSCVERELRDTKLQTCNFDEGLGRVIWRAQIDGRALRAMSLAPGRMNDEARRELRDQLVEIAGAAWRAARDLNVEDAIPF